MARSFNLVVLAFALACTSAPGSQISDGEVPEETADAAPPSGPPRDLGQPRENDAAAAADVAGATADVATVADVTPVGSGPNVDRATPQLHAVVFKASAADPAATKLLGDEQAFVDTRAPTRGTLVVHLHGSGEKTLCGYTEHGKLLASFGFHVFMPCYDAAVSWSNSACGGDVGACRLEMLEGVDHDARLDIAPPQAIEVRIVKALIYLKAMNPAGDWGYFLEGDKPRWSRMIISGQSFGATSSFLIAKHREVVRAVALSGPLDGGAKWLKEPSLTPLERMYSFSHVNDGQHPTHMNSLQAMGVPGSPVNVEMSMPPYDGSHRLVGAMKTYGGATIDGHNATEARTQSPKDEATGKYVYEPVWRYMYGVE
ncbi:MAG TPA: hypothetical protein VN914_03690 [Polyangia bacterium]|nr:hypothetical protein [Polyangia bacterium]